MNGNGDTGTVIGPLGNVPLSAEKLFECIACHCDKCVDAQDKAAGRKCSSASGTRKHTCCETQIRRHINNGNSPKVQGTVGYIPDSITGASTGITAAKVKFSLWPDAASLGPHGITQFFDFKFSCDKSKVPRWGKCRGGKSQFDAYRQLFPAARPEPIDITGCGSLSAKDCPDDMTC